jgi:Ca2+-binding RTX toxin-like protein
MAVTQVSGSDFINSSGLRLRDSLPFKSYVTFGALADESWNIQSVDDAASKGTNKWSSKEGSSLTFSYADIGTETNGSTSENFSLSGKLTGTKCLASKFESQTAKSYIFTESVNWSYTAGTSAKDDDFTVKYSVSEKNNLENGSFVRSRGVEFATGFNTIKYSQSGSGDANSTISKIIYSFKNTEKNESLSFSGVISEDQSADKVMLSLLNVKYQGADFNVSTSKYNDNFTIAGFEQIPDVTADALSFDAILSNSLTLNSFTLSADNTIVVTTKVGAIINAGAGNDTVTGGVGNDMIAGGSGKDRLTGGKGNDVFSLSKSDFDFTSAKTVQADTITDFKYTATEKDSISLDGFGSVGVFQTVALAKKAGSTANVIYESKTGNFWYNDDGDSALVGALLFANAKGIPDSYWVAAGVL